MLAAAEGRYRTIVADPPWPYGDGPTLQQREAGIREFLPYSTMSLDEIRALPVRDLSDNVDQDAHLYLWTTDQFLREAFDIARAWGFHHRAVIVWCKRIAVGPGVGGIWPANVEFVLFCRRPKVTTRPDVLRLTTYLANVAEAAGVSRRTLNVAMGTSDMAGWWLSRIETRCACPTGEQWPGIKAALGIGDEMDATVREINARKGTSPAKSLTRTPGRWYVWPRGRHSAKPGAFLDLVERVSPGPYLELFARRARPGWDCWGDEAPNPIDWNPAPMKRRVLQGD